jgi:hypothetical protein
VIAKWIWTLLNSFEASSAANAEEENTEQIMLLVSLTSDNGVIMTKSELYNPYHGRVDSVRVSLRVILNRGLAIGVMLHTRSTSSRVKI